MFLQTFIMLGGQKRSFIPLIDLDISDKFAGLKKIIATPYLKIYIPKMLSQINPNQTESKL